MTAEELAQAFHEAYEKFSPEFNAPTVPWKDASPKYRALMARAAGELLGQFNLVDQMPYLSKGPRDELGHLAPFGSRFMTNRYGCIGVVAVNDPIMHTWKAYIGICKGENTKEDQTSVALWGNKLPKEVAHAFFPHINEEEYSE